MHQVFLSETTVITTGNSRKNTEEKNKHTEKIHRKKQAYDNMWFLLSLAGSLS